MPSTSAKQHRFMEAIAHNPAFAKKAGVSQSVGKEFAAADKGKKFVRGGINKQDTHHGKMDLPFNKLNRHAGMKSGGFMKKKIRKFAEGGPNNPPDVPAQEYSEAAEKFLGKADRTDPFIINRMKKAVPNYKKATAAFSSNDVDENAAVAPAKTTKPNVSSNVDDGINSYAERQTSTRIKNAVGGDETEGPQGKLEGLRISNRSRPAAAPARAAVADSRPYTRVPAAVDNRPYIRVPVDEAAAARRREAQNTASSGGRALSSAESRAAAQNTASPGFRATRAEREAPPAPAPTPVREVVSNNDEPKKRERPKDSPNFFNQVFRKLTGDTTAANTRMKKGGSIKRFAQGGMMKESKAMVGKEMNFMKKKGAPKSMIKHEAAEMGAMKKGGMPMKDGRPAFMQKKMMGGGMAKYAKGGGIESKGKTKGTIIKMATGGVVGFARGGGIESRGKTKGTMIKMKGC